MTTPFVPVRPPRTTGLGPPQPGASPAPDSPLELPEETAAFEDGARDLPALGTLGRFARDPAVTDLLVDGDGTLWVDRGVGLLRQPGLPPLPAPAARRLAVALIAAGGRHLDDATPFADVRLGDGIRVHAVLPPVSTAGPLLSVRIGRAAPWRLAALHEQGAVDDHQLAQLLAAVRERRNVLVCGPAGSGKTSLLAALMAEVPPTERIVTIEDVAELAIDHPHVVGLEARQPNADGAGGVGLAALVREALRMRPDRLVLGECRGAEVAELLSALNTGHDGGAGTLHCASLDGLGARLEALGALAGLEPEALRAQAVAAIDVVVQLGRHAGHRGVTRIGRLTDRPGGGLQVVDA